MEDAPERPGLDHRSTSPSTPSATLPNVDSTEQRDFNYLALVAFIASASALLTVSFAPGSFVVLLAIGLLLGIAALVQCIVRKDRGMGFAIAAILIPLSFIFLLLLYASGGYLH